MNTCRKFQSTLTYSYKINIKKHLWLIIYSLDWLHCITSECNK